MPGLKQGELFESSPPARILVIDMWPHWTDCTICGQECGLEFGLAIYEDRIVPDEYEGEWGGAPACKRCYDRSRELQALRPGEFITFQEVRRC